MSKFEEVSIEVDEPIKGNLKAAIYIEAEEGKVCHEAIINMTINGVRVDTYSVFITEGSSRYGLIEGELRIKFASPDFDGAYDLPLPDKTIDQVIYHNEVA